MNNGFLAERISSIYRVGWLPLTPQDFHNQAKGDRDGSEFTGNVRSQPYDAAASLEFFPQLIASIMEVCAKEVGVGDGSFVEVASGVFVVKDCFGLGGTHDGADEVRQGFLCLSVVYIGEVFVFGCLGPYLRSVEISEVGHVVPPF